MTRLRLRVSGAVGGVRVLVVVGPCVEGGDGWER
jgi:hypothetical protein